MVIHTYDDDIRLLYKNTLQLATESKEEARQRLSFFSSSPPHPHITTLAQVEKAVKHKRTRVNLISPFTLLTLLVRTLQNEVSETYKHNTILSKYIEMSTENVKTTIALQSIL